MKHQIAAPLGRLLLLVVLAGSAAYVGLSMYRWEWQRAIFAALAFLGALGVLLFLALLRRLDRLERRLDQVGSASRAGTVGSGRVPGEGGPGYGVSAQPAQDFAWLGPPHGTYVFVPLLLGFGVLVSLLAVAVERLAGFVVGAPSGGGPARVGALHPPDRRRRSPLRMAGLAVAAFAMATALAGLLVPGIQDVIYDPEEPTPGRREMVIEVDARRVAVEATDTVAALAVYCREQMQAPIVVDSVEYVSQYEARLTVYPRLAPQAQRRYTGCLQDLVMDRHLARVLSVRDVAD